MANNLVRNNIDASTNFVITLDALASTILGLGAVGRQGTVISTPSPARMNCKIVANIVQGANPTGNRQAVIYYLKGDGHATPYATDGAGLGDAAITLFTASILAVQGNKAAPSTGEIIRLEAVIRDVDVVFGVAFAHDTGVNLGVGSYIRYQLFTPEIQ